MKQNLAFALVIVLLFGALVYAEKTKVDAPVGAQSILYFIGDSQRELTRMPSHFTRIPDAEEVRFGDALATRILADRTMDVPARAIEADLAAIMARMAPHVHRRIPMKVHFLPDPYLVNAFAIPGGHLFFGAGLLDELKTEDQVAAVLAHEIEHVDRYHCAERLQVEAALRKIPLGLLVELPIAVFQAGYSKSEELEADREGILLAARGGYSAAGAIGVMELFAAMEEGQSSAAMTPQQEVLQVAAGAVTGYFRTHPWTADRIAQARTMIARQPALASTPQRPLPPSARPAVATSSVGAVDQ